MLIFVLGCSTHLRKSIGWNLAPEEKNNFIPPGLVKIYKVDPNRKLIPVRTITEKLHAATLSPKSV